MEGRDPIVERAYGVRSLNADKIALDDYVASYTNPWEPEYFSRLEDARPATSPIYFRGYYEDEEIEADFAAQPDAGCWSMTVRCDRMWNKRLGTLKVTGDAEGELFLALV